MILIGSQHKNPMILEYDMKDCWMKKGLVVSVIFLFIGVAIAPSINTSVVKASDDDDLVEVTTQACGIKGYGNTTVKLTREQYRNLEQYLVEFRARLNQTSTRDEAVPIFKEAVVELNKYGLLPKGMSVERALKVITGVYNNKNIMKVQETLLRSHLLTQEDMSNDFCLIAGQTTNTLIQPILNYFTQIPLLTIEVIPIILLFVLFAAGWIIGGTDTIIFTILFGLLYIPFTIPLVCYLLYMKYSCERQKILIGADLYLFNSTGWVDTIGLTGKKSINGSLRGQIPLSQFEESMKGFFKYIYEKCALCNYSHLG